MILPARAIGIMLVLMVVMFFVTVGITSILESYLYSRHIAVAMSGERALTVKRLVTYITIESVDPKANVITATTHSLIANMPVRIRFTFDDSLSIERQDAILENGTFIRIGERTFVTLQDVVPGMRAQVVYTQANKSAFLQRMLIGDPFPRP